MLRSVPLIARLACLGLISAVLGGCPREIEPDPIGPADTFDLDAYKAGDAQQDTVLDVAIKLDVAKDVPADTKTDASKPDVVVLKEQCGNYLDDDGDGLVDEDACLVTPNLRPDQAWHDLGLVEIGTATTVAPTRQHGAAGKNEGMLLVARDMTADSKAYLWAETLVSPAGVQVLTPGGWATSYNRAFHNVSAATALVGMAPQISLVAGPWTFGFVRSDETPLKYTGKPLPGWVHLGVQTRPDLPGAKPAFLDLDVICVGGVPMPCAQLVKSLQWKQIAEKVETVWKPASIRLGTVTFTDLGGDLGKKYTYVDNVFSAYSDNELNGAYQAAGALRPKSTAVTLLLVAGLHDNSLPVAVGLSQLAGVSGLPGSRLNGMAMAIDPDKWKQVVAEGANSTNAAAIWGVTLAHEIGHFLGLWHTDEHDGALHDVIDDTPVCDKKDVKLTPDTCPIQAKYVMFWSPTGTTVTSGQAKVVRRSPALR